jgi:DNA-binding transcriptional LysR family regulator
MGPRSRCHNDAHVRIIRSQMIQMTDLLETSELLAFTCTVEARSLSRAAKTLGVPRATIGRRLGRLEEQLGVRLLRRTTRALALTDAGEVLYRHARIVLDAVKTAEASVRRSDDAVRGDLRVSLPPYADPAFNAMIADFSRRYPDVRLYVHTSTVHVDLLRDGYDVVVRASAEFEPGLVARNIARSRAVAVASPGYLAERGVPKAARDLARHRCLVGFSRGESPEVHWPTPSGRKVSVTGALVTNDLALLRDLAVAGQGIALLPRLLIEPELANGELRVVLDDKVGREERIAIVHAEREFVPPQVRAFVDAVVAWAAGGRAVPTLPRRPRG